MALSSTPRIMAALRKRYGTPDAPPAGRDPLALILSEMVAYLADDDTARGRRSPRSRGVSGSRRSVVLKRARFAVLAAICRLGRPGAAGQRARRMRLRSPRSSSTSSAATSRRCSRGTTPRP